MFKAIKSILLLLVVLIIFIIVMVFDLSPQVESNAGARVDNAESVQSLLNQMRQSLRQRYQGQTLMVSSQQAQSLAGFLQRAREQANAKVNFSAETMRIEVSYELATFVQPVYLNLIIDVLEGPGVNIERFSVGSLRLPGNWVLGWAEKAANAYTNSAVASQAIATVEHLDISEQGVDIRLAPLDTLLREFKNIKSSGSSEESRLFKIKVAHYLRILDEFDMQLTKADRKGVSLALYMQALMQEANIMSKRSSPALENEAAIMALTIYAGSPRFAALLGDLSFAINRIPVARPKPILKNRRDLSLHFIFSAAIKLLSEKGVSVAVGEFKELMDRGQGGSGYSFVDLAADLSGAHFAALAVDPNSAEHVQKVLMLAPNEALFMSPIADLEEGMSKAQFEHKYSQVDSLQYRLVLEGINQRIEQLAINK